VLKQEEEDALVAADTPASTRTGNSEGHLPAQHAPKFAGLLDDGTPDPAVTPYVETRIVKDEKILAALMKATPGKETGPWVSSVPNSTRYPKTPKTRAGSRAIAGQLDEAQRKADRAKG